ncbi:MAG TPA: dipeptide ABC transporter ATP-binding protein [Desulfocapsa sulfexigens]|nr:dipeptide ABC transporter ATP-binding protein [Desulfocapsa sulfexigens]
MSDSIVIIDDLVKYFDISGGFLEQLQFKSGKVIRQKTEVKAVNGVSLEIKKGETLAVVGESGCGKSTLARTVIGLYPPTSGQVFYRGQRIDNLSPKQMLPYRRRMQMIFQDPYASLNPRKSVRQTLEEPIRFHMPKSNKKEVKERVAYVMKQVGVNPGWKDRFPHEFSGGQRQRIAIARSLVVDPGFIIADEPVSALDVSIQAQILNLLMDAQEERGLTYLFITHDLSVVRHIAARVAVMYLGTLCELATTAELYNNPRHPYTQALLSAIPAIDGRKKQHIRLPGEIPTPINLPKGCVFHGRCIHANDRCLNEIPVLLQVGDSSGSYVACHGVEEGRV